MSDEKPHTSQPPRELDLVALALPNAPAGEDEFAGMEPYRPRRSPILAVAVILLCGYLVFHMRSDLVYALRSRTPVEIADVRSHFAHPANVRSNIYVRLRAVPDRATAVMLDAKGKDEFIPFERVMGTRSRLLIAERRGMRPVGEVYDDVYAGRLLRLSEISYADTVQEHYAKQRGGTQFFNPEDVCSRLGQVPTRLRALSGDEVELRADQVVGMDVTFPGEYVVTMHRERFPNEADGRSALERLGAEVRESKETKTDLSFVVHVADERRDALIEGLGKLDARCQIVLRRGTYEMPWGRLSAGQGNIVLPAAPGHASCAWVTSFFTVEKLEIPEDAFILVEGERPQDLWYVPVFGALFLFFIVWNVLALGAALRTRSQAKPSSQST